MKHHDGLKEKDVCSFSYCRVTEAGKMDEENSVEILCENGCVQKDGLYLSNLPI